MLFKWLDTSEVDALATSLVSEFTQRVPSNSGESAVRGANSRRKDAIETLLNRVGKFAAGHQLNLYKRARLANSLKWSLQEAGYEKAMVDDLALAVAKKVSITRYSGQNSSSKDKIT